MSDQPDVISPIELEDILNILRPTLELERVGNREWSRQMSMMEELNVQAAVEAGRGGEENVRQLLVEQQKMPLFVHEVLVTEIWRENVLPRILKLGTPESSFQVNVIGLLILHHNLIVLLIVLLCFYYANCFSDLHGLIQRSKHVQLVGNDIIQQ